ncbi:MAG: helix-turn-helix domain-containing protein [Verrucomicrobia bacterium]|nr:helix-turn-helix domain-containing protein [Verrucomicrobiota bacterium]
MRSTGDLLRAERERRRLTVTQVADATKIKGDHIRAIEADEWGAFSAPVYVRGFVKTYARHLRLDVEAIAAQLDAELAGRGDFEERGLGGGALRRGPLDFVMLKLALLRWQVLFPLALGIALILSAWWAWNAWQRRPVSAPVLPATQRLHQPAPRPGSSAPLLPLPPATNGPVRVPGR